MATTSKSSDEDAQKTAVKALVKEALTEVLGEERTKWEAENKSRTNGTTPEQNPDDKGGSTLLGFLFSPNR